VCIVVASIDILGGQAIQALRLIEVCERSLESKLRYCRSIRDYRGASLAAENQNMFETLLPRSFTSQVCWCDCSVSTSCLFSLGSYFSFLLAPAPAILISKLYGKPVLLITTVVRLKITCDDGLEPRASDYQARRSRRGAVRLSVEVFARFVC